MKPGDAGTAVLVMAYGTPRHLDEVETYYTDIRHGRPPSPEQLAELTGRYQAIGGRSPLLEITEAQARGIEHRLGGPRVYIGLKHAAPFIRDAVESIVDGGASRIVGLVLAPHYSSMSVGDYRRRTERAAGELRWEGSIKIIESWHLHPGYVELLAGYVRSAIHELPSDLQHDATVFFTAHSLPAQILATGDPYADQLQETAKAVAENARLDRWDTAWQSAGRTDADWLGPDITEALRDLAERSGRAAVICPCGFVADHLEVLYDIDIEAKQLATELGLAFVRTRSPNDDPAFLDVLADVVGGALTPG